MQHDEFAPDIWNTACDEALKYVEWLTPKPTEYRAAEYVLAVSFARVLTAEREACAHMADEWPEVETLLPLASPDHNEGARVGQYEAAERIASAIRTRGPATN